MSLPLKFDTGTLYLSVSRPPRWESARTHQRRKMMASSLIAFTLMLLPCEALLLQPCHRMGAVASRARITVMDDGDDGTPKIGSCKCTHLARKWSCFEYGELHIHIHRASPCAPHILTVSRVAIGRVQHGEGLRIYRNRW